jgi:hypothetical protein
MGLAGTATPHLFSGVIAVGLAAAILFAGRMIAIHLEHNAVHALALRAFPVKNQGLAFQSAAARTQGVPSLDRRSELLSPVWERADVFFSAPTGFQASPVGKVGTTPLIMLQELAALGADVRDYRTLRIRHITGPYLLRGVSQGVDRVSIFCWIVLQLRVGRC